MLIIITKSYNSSDKTESITKTISYIGELVNYFNNQITRNKQDDIFNGLTYNDPGDETWNIDVDGYSFEIKTWKELDIAIQGLFIGVSNPWYKFEEVLK